MYIVCYGKYQSTQNAFDERSDGKTQEKRLLSCQLGFLVLFQLPPFHGQNQDLLAPFG